MGKRGELTLNVIVMATIALIVLIVLTFIFLKGARLGDDGLLSCESKQGTCKPDCLGTETTSSWSCDKKGSVEQKCCTKEGTILGFDFNEDT